MTTAKPDGDPNGILTAGRTLPDNRAAARVGDLTDVNAQTGPLRVFRC